MDLIVITAKRRGLLPSRKYMQVQNTCSATAPLLLEWKLIGRQANMTHALQMLRNLGYLQLFAMDKAYVQFPDLRASDRSIRKRLYIFLMNKRFTAIFRIL
jgi:hypothetical protein